MSAHVAKGIGDSSRKCHDYSDTLLEEAIKRIQQENSKQQTTMLRWTIASALCAFGAFIVSLVALLDTR